MLLQIEEKSWSKKEKKMQKKKKLQASVVVVNSWIQSYEIRDHREYLPRFTQESRMSHSLGNQILHQTVIIDK